MRAVRPHDECAARVDFLLNTRGRVLWRDSCERIRIKSPLLGCRWSDNKYYTHTNVRIELL